MKQKQQKHHTIVQRTASRLAKSQKLIATDFEENKKLKNLFYVRSKHTRKQFKNHPYFRMTAGINSAQVSFDSNEQATSGKKASKLINQRRLKTQSCIAHLDVSEQICKQFVNYPQQYGLQNTYNYLKQKSFIAKFQFQNSHKSHQLKNQHYFNSKHTAFHNLDGDSSHLKNYMKVTAAYQSKFYSTAHCQQINKFSLRYKKESLENQRGVFSRKFPNKIRSTLSQKLKKVQIEQPTASIRQKMMSVEVRNQPLQRKIDKSQLTLCKNVIYNSSPFVESRANVAFQNLSLPAHHIVEFIYTKRLKSIYEIPYRRVEFDLFSYIILTFLKCKIHYNQLLQYEYDFILKAIIKVLDCKKKQKKYDLKDVVNLGTVKNLIQFLEQLKGEENNFQWVETVKYFFILKDEKVLQYYMNKIKEDVALLISIKFDAQFGQKGLYVVDLEKKQNVKDLYDLMRGKKFLIGDQPNILVNYLNVENQQFERQTLQTKIKKWKSIAEGVPKPGHYLQYSNISEPRLPSRVYYPSSKKIMNEPKKISVQKFNNLFQQFKVRQKKRNSKRYWSNAISGGNSLQSSFIDRSKLKKSVQFFQ